MAESGAARGAAPGGRGGGGGHPRHRAPMTVVRTRRLYTELLSRRKIQNTIGRICPTFGLRKLYPSSKVLAARDLQRTLYG